MLSALSKDALSTELNASGGATCSACPLRARGPRKVTSPSETPAGLGGSGPAGPTPQGHVGLWRWLVLNQGNSAPAPGKGQHSETFRVVTCQVGRGQRCGSTSFLPVENFPAPSAVCPSEAEKLLRTEKWGVAPAVTSAAILSSGSRGRPRISVQGHSRPPPFARGGLSSGPRTCL